MSRPDLKEVSRRIREAALAAADPSAAVLRSLAATGRGITACGREYDNIRRLILVAVGKASLAMAGAARIALGHRVSEGIVVIPHGYPRGASGDPRIAILEAGHPLPDEPGLRAARRVAEIVENMREDDLCVFLLSGGGSSLLPLPYPPLRLRDKIETTSLLLKSGADILEINTVRKHLSAIKGGRLANRTRGTIVTLAISDVVGDQVGFISSGPTVADPTTFADAAGVLERYGVSSRVPPAVKAFIEDGIAGRIPETPKTLPARFRADIVASSRLAVEAAETEARRQGFAPIVLTAELDGEAREAGAMMAAAAREVKLRGRPVPAPACLIAAGETIVTVRGAGHGGRNQEIALAAAIELAGETGILLTSFATDGREGNTNAAGAYASGHTIAAGRSAGCDPLACLAANDAHTFLSAAGELIFTGPTGTNVNDMTFTLVEREGP